jgi:RNA polymerase sigma-70 factor (ECF subfamily)
MTAPCAPYTASASEPSQEVRLLQRVRDRADTGAWEEFVEVYQPMIRAFVRRHGVTASDVPDIVQDIFVRLIPTLARFRFDPSRGRFRTWLWRVASNAVANWNRKRISRARTEATWHERQSAYALGGSASAEEVQTHCQNLLNRVLVEIREATLPATWACFEGRILRARPALELAIELGVSRNSVYVNASRVLAQVRKRCIRSAALSAGS